MNRFVERFVAFLLTVFLLFYTGYQAMRYFEKGYETQAALGYSTADSLKVTGVIVRNETVIKDQVNGVVSYLHDDGTKVTIYTPLAEIYPDEKNVQLQKQIRELDREIQMLQEASDKTSLQYINAETLSRQISQAVSQVVSISSNGLVGDISQQQRNLTMLLNRNQMVTGKSQGYQERIDSLTKQRDQLQGQLQTNYTSFMSPGYGYFVRTVDFLEEELTPKAVEGMTVAQIEAYTGQQVQNSTQYMGKIVGDHNWIYAAVIPKEQVNKFHTGDTVSLNFNLFNLTDVPFVVQEVKNDDSSSNAVVLLHSNYVLPELMEVRTPSAEIVFKAYSGLKVPASSKRYENGAVGVYILENEVIRFRTIHILYENDEFIICGPDLESERPLKLFDQVIVEGTDLRDGKSVK